MGISGRITFASFLTLAFTMAAYGQVTFFQPPILASGTPFVADFNLDGKPDILSGVTMQLAEGDGTFMVTMLPIYPYPSSVGDFNGDSKPDIVAQDTFAKTLLVLIGNGDGTFQNAVTTNTGISLVGIATGDLNLDGRTDFVGISSNSVYVFLSNADGTFANGVPYSIPTPSGSNPFVLLSDVNGDGKVDATVATEADNSDGQIIVFLGNGDGTLQSLPKASLGVPSVSVSSFPDYAVLADFNGDSKLDLAINAGQICNPTCSGTANISVLLGNGDGTFSVPTTVISAVGPIASADLNNDGKFDLVLQTESTVTEIWLGTGDGTFSNSANYEVALLGPYDIEAPTGIAVADFNLDGKLDITLNSVLLLGDGDGTFQANPMGVTPDTVSAAVIGDFDKNGTQDVAVASGTTSDSVTILTNNGAGVLSAGSAYTLQQPGSGITASDFNGDGNLDLMVFGTDPVTQQWSYSVLLGNGDGTLQPAVFYPQYVETAIFFYSIVVGDFNHDNKPDVAAALGDGFTNQSLVVLLGNGDGTFGQPVYLSDDGASVVFTADFNGDGNLDLAAGASPPNSMPETALLFGNGDGSFQPAVFPSNLTGTFPESTGDFNNDGKPDLLTTNDVAFLGNGDGTFTVLSPSPYCAIQLAGCILPQAVADFNGDGALDFIGLQWFNHPDHTGILLGSGDGTFGSLINVPAKPGILSFDFLLSADMNGDGHADVVYRVLPVNNIVQPGVSGVGVLLNTTTRGIGLSVSPTGISVAPGSSSTASIRVYPSFGFNGTVTLSCSGLPAGVTCTFNPVTIPNSSGASTLTVAATINVPPGNYSFVLHAASGVTLNNTTVSLFVFSPVFYINLASGEGNLKTVTAGQSASWSLDAYSVGTFAGTVNLSCGLVSGSPSPPPTCQLSASSVQLTPNSTQPVTVTLATSSGTAGMLLQTHSRLRWLALAWTGTMLLVCGLLLTKNRRRTPFLATVILTLSLWIGCGGGSSLGGDGSSNGGNGPRTPAGTYSFNVVASSGGLSASAAIELVVQ
jgi:hypothetical protein